MNEKSINNPHKTLLSQQDKEKARIFLLWLSIVSIIMLFAGLTSALIVRKNTDTWFVFQIPSVFTISTVVLLMSSISMIGARIFTKLGKKIAASFMLLLTLMLGITFAILQWGGWIYLVEKLKIYFVSDTVSGSFFYVLTGLHLIHVFAGLIALLVTTINSFIGKYSPKNYLGLKLTSIFWHFLDGLWIYLFVFLHLANQKIL